MTAAKPLSRDARAEAELATLRKLWDQREQMIPVFPGGWDGPWRLVLSADHKKPADVDDWPAEPPVSWQKLQIRPGRMFTDRDGYVGYWHEVVIPGSVIDELLRLATARLLAHAGELIGTLDQELVRRGAGNAPVADWAELSRQLIAAVDAPVAERAVKLNDGAEWGRRVLACLDHGSLEGLRAALISGEGLRLARDGTKFRVTLPLSRRDATGMAALAKAYQVVLVRLAQDEPDNALLALAVRMGGSLSMASEGDASCTVTLDPLPALNEFFELCRSEGAKRFAADAEARADANAMARAIERWNGAAIDAGVDVEKLKRELLTPRRGN
jgi:hypothetical protein